jgi:hypothetical protein
MPPLRSSLAVALSAAALVLLLAGCAGDDRASEVPSTTTGEVSAHVAADPCSLDSSHHSHLRQRCTRGAEQEVVQRPVRAPDAATQAARCERPTLMQVYAQDDWIGIAKTLASAPAGCLEAWISVPTEPGSDGAWLTTRPGMKNRFAKIGGNVTPMPEVNFNDWNAWGKQHPTVSWFERGRRARAEMERAGYDFDSGDHWTLNEIPVAALVDGADRKAVSDLVRGLQGNSKQPTGVIYVVMTPQPDGMTPALESELRAWFADTAFWNVMERGAVAWSSEAYASIRDTCEPGTSAAQQVKALRRYAFHREVFAERLALQSDSAVAKVLERSVPLTNAAWAWTEAYGFTAVPAQLMKRFIALQVQATTRLLPDGTPVVGFGWAPKRSEGMSDAAYRNDLAIVAAAIRDAVVNDNRTNDRTHPKPCSYAGAQLKQW